jgi:4'-phosphopantetheinyl transferase
LSSQDAWANPEHIPCGSADVHVWCATLDPPRSRVQTLFSLLSPDERQRAARYYFQKDRDRFIVGRATLRLILGRYLACPSDRLRFTYNEYGKPALHRARGCDALRFNVSHSHGLAMFAITRGREVGLDVELIRRDLPLEIAERFFSRREVSMLQALPTSQQTRAFFNCWTRKEAYIKARGEGLSRALHQFTVSLIPGEPAALLSAENDPGEAFRWSFQELAPDPAYAAAIAAEGIDLKVVCRRWRA